MESLINQITPSFTTLGPPKSSVLATNISPNISKVGWIKDNAFDTHGKLSVTSEPHYKHGVSLQIGGHHHGEQNNKQVQNKSVGVTDHVIKRNAQKHYYMCGPFPCCHGDKW